MRKKERETIKVDQICERERERERESEISERREEIPVMRRQHSEDDRPADGGGVASSLVIKVKEKRKG